MDIMFAYLLMDKLVRERPILWYATFIFLTPFFFFECSLWLIRVILFQSGPDISLRSEWGVNYRALNDLFEISQNRKGSISYEIGVQMVEIYNEQVRDLLSTGGGLPKRYPTLNILYYFIMFIKKKYIYFVV